MFIATIFPISVTISFIQGSTWPSVAGPQCMSGPNKFGGLRPYEDYMLRLKSSTNLTRTCFLKPPFYRFGLLVHCMYTMNTIYTEGELLHIICRAFSESYSGLEGGKKGPHVRWNGFEWEETLITIDSTRTRTRTSKSTGVPVGSNADHH